MQGLRREVEPMRHSKEVKDLENQSMNNGKPLKTLDCKLHDQSF